MNIFSMLGRSGFFALVAWRAVIYTRGDSGRVLWIFCGLTVVFSAFLDNVMIS